MDPQNSHNPFNLPNDYFSAFKQKISDRILREDELKEFPVLKSISDTGFIVPESYFETISRKTELLTYPTLSDIEKNKENRFEVPEGYFGNNSEQLNKLVSGSSILHSVRKPGFDVPSDYFEQHKKRISEKLHTPQETIIIRIFKRKTFYAAAALLVICFGVWLYKFRNNPDDLMPEDCRTLACIEKRELLKFKLQHLETDELYELVNPEELERKLNGSDTLTHFSDPKNDSVQNDLMDYLE